MSEQTFWGIVGVFTIIVVGIAGALWKHVIEDAKVRERLATLEADAEASQEEIRNLRTRWHDLRDSTLKDLWEMMQERFDAFRAEMQRLFSRDK